VIQSSVTIINEVAGETILSRKCNSFSCRFVTVSELRHSTIEPSFYFVIFDFYRVETILFNNISVDFLAYNKRSKKTLPKSPCRYGAVLSLHGPTSLLLWLRLSVVRVLGSQGMSRVIELREVQENSPDGTRSLVLIYRV
jgi:hypothetical protein